MRSHLGREGAHSPPPACAVVPFGATRDVHVQGRRDSPHHLLESYLSEFIVWHRWGNAIERSRGETLKAKSVENTRSKQTHNFYILLRELCGFHVQKCLPSGNRPP